MKLQGVGDFEKKYIYIYVHQSWTLTCTPKNSYLRPLSKKLAHIHGAKKACYMIKIVERF